MEYLLLLISFAVILHGICHIQLTQQGREQR